MRLLRPLLIATVVLLGPAAGLAHAVTIPQLLALMRAGLSDEVLIALIETDGSVFQLSATDVLNLHRQGVSDRVIIAMTQTARKAQQAALRDIAVQAPSIDQPAPTTAQVAPAPAPVVNVYQTVSQHVEPSTQPYYSNVIAIPVAVPVPVLSRPVVAPARPVYWGWGGERRPDAWRDNPDHRNPPAQDDRKDDKKKGGGF